MNKLYITKKIIGKWDLIVDTPFGKEKYTLKIDQDGDHLLGYVESEKGSAKIIEPTFNDDTLIFHVETEFPITSSVFIEANLIEDNTMSGSLRVDEYLLTSFIGKKYESI
jgi:hypothetical protein